MSDPIHCPDCGVELPPGQPKGLCPRCALKGALELSEATSDPHPASGHPLPSDDDFATEDGHPLEPADSLAPERVFERRWAQTLMDRAVKRLQDEYTADGKAALFEALKDLQPGLHGSTSYAELGARLGLSEVGVKSAVHRFRRRHHEILREEISHTVTRSEEVGEIRHLIEIVGR